MLDLNDLRYFVEVANRGAFTAAARALEMPTSTISHRIRELEKAVGLTLFARSPRKVSMTEAGEELYRHAVATLERAEAAQRAMQSRTKTVSGEVRYTLAVATATFAMPPVVSSFLRAQPGVRLVELAINRRVDLALEHFDLAIRAHSGELRDSGLVTRPLAEVPWFLFAAPSYVAEHGPFVGPEDLASQSTLFMKRGKLVPAWSLVRSRGKAHDPFVVALEPRIVGGCMATLKSAAVAGLGIVALPGYVCREEMTAGALQRVLPDWVAEKSRLTALFRAPPSAATSAFLEHLVRELPRAVRVSD